MTSGNIPMTTPTGSPEQILTEQEAQLLAAFEQLSEDDQLAVTRVAEQIAEREQAQNEPMTREDVEALFAAVKSQGKSD